MKRLTLSIAALMLAGIAFAQPPGGGRHFDRMTETLDLDDHQATEVQRILQASHAKLREQMEVARAASFAETVEQLRSVLTEEQLEEFVALREARRERMGHRRGKRSDRDSAQ